MMTMIAISIVDIVVSTADVVLIILTSLLFLALALETQSSFRPQAEALKKLPCLFL